MARRFLIKPLKTLSNKRIIDRYYDRFGYQIQIRMLPYAFLGDVKQISHLIDNDKFKEAEVAIKAAYRKWGDDPDLIRLDNMNIFMTDSDEQT